MQKVLWSQSLVAGSDEETGDTNDERGVYDGTAGAVAIEYDDSCGGIDPLQEFLVIAEEKFAFLNGVLMRGYDLNIEL